MVKGSESGYRNNDSTILTHPKLPHHTTENQPIPHDKFRFHHTKALIHSL